MQPLTLDNRIGGTGFSNTYAKGQNRIVSDTYDREQDRLASNYGQDLLDRAAQLTQTGRFVEAEKLVQILIQENGGKAENAIKQLEKLGRSGAQSFIQMPTHADHGEAKSDQGCMIEGQDGQAKMLVGLGEYD